MKICYLANAGSIHTQRWANYFAERGHEITLISWHPPEIQSGFHKNISIKRILCPPHSIARYGALFEISRIIHQIKPDIIHAHYIGHFGILADMYRKKTGFSPIVLTAWGSDILIDPIGAKKERIKSALQHADLITCDAAHMKKTMVEQFNVNPEKIQYIFFGTDPKKFEPINGLTTIREKYGIANRPIIISLRSLEPIYDIQTLIKAIPLIRKEIPNVLVIIGGRGSLETELKELTSTLGLSDNVIFAGFIQSDELPLYLNSSDIYVSTSLSDAGLAASTAEAMSCGLPVVITDYGENYMWVNNGDGGFLFPLRDHNTLAEQVIYLLKNEERRKLFGTRNREIILKLNNYYVEMEKVEKMYLKLLNKN